MENKIDITYELRDIVVCALRYALPRHTYALEEVCSFIKKHKCLLDERTVGVMLRDVNTALLQYDKSIWEMDKETIEDLRCFLENYECEEYEKSSNKDAD